MQLLAKIEDKITSILRKRDNHKKYIEYYSNMLGDPKDIILKLKFHNAKPSLGYNITPKDVYKMAKRYAVFYPVLAGSDLSEDKAKKLKFRTAHLTQKVQQKHSW